LTPIQLSAQRLRRKYSHWLSGEDRTVFDECTSLIINSVEELRMLVNEFSSLARMPPAKLALYDIKLIIRDAILLYKDSHKDIAFRFAESNDIPLFKFDKEQIKRVMINLLDNAVAAISDKGEIVVSLFSKMHQALLGLKWLILVKVYPIKIKRCFLNHISLQKIWDRPGAGYCE